MKLSILLACLAAGSLLAGCAGGPTARERERWESLRLEAVAQLERGTPEALRQALVLAGSAELSFRGEADQTAALAAALFRLLYPELARQAGAPQAPAYTGPWAAALALAEEGRPPAGQLAPEPAGGAWLGVLLPHLHLARLLAGSGAPRGAPPAEAAIAALLQAAAERPDSVLPPYLLGLVAELAGDPAAAAQAYRDCLQRAGSFYPARLRLASLHLVAGETAAALSDMEAALEAVPDDVALHRRLAEIALAEGRLDLAQEHSARVLDQEPHDPEHLLLRARVLAASRSWPQALKLLDLALAAGPDLAAALLLKAEILAANAHEEEQALELLREAQTRIPGDARLPELEGRILFAAGRESEGRTRLERALELEPGRESALRLLLEQAVRRQQWDRAAETLERLLEAGGSEADLVLAHRAQERLGNQDRALAYATRLYALRPEAYAAEYAAALLAHGQRDEALRVVEKHLSAASPQLSSRLLVVRAAALEAQDPEGTLEILQQALVLDPANQAALVKLAELYAARLDYRKAGLYLRQALAQDPENVDLQTRLERLNY